MDFRPTVVTGGSGRSRAMAQAPTLPDGHTSVDRDATPPPPVRQTKGSIPVAVIKVSRFWSSSRPAAPVLAGGRAEEGLDAFGSEVGALELLDSTPLPNTDVRVERTEFRPGAGALALVIAFTLCGLAAAATVWQYQARVAASALGSLTLNTVPAGADVLIAGKMAGRTPLITNLPAGTHDIHVVSGAQQRDLKVTVAAGASTVHVLEFPVVAAPVAAPNGALHVQADFRPATVTVDGVERGASPITIEALEPGTHDVVVRGERGTFRRSVLIKPHETMSLVISPSEASANLPGWLAVSAPVVMQLREGGRLIGTTETDRLMLPAGEHEIEIVNEALGVRSMRKVTVVAGKTATTTIELPTGLLSINALPWAEVWVDGDRIGETPIANLSKRVGSHEIVFRHPQFGERTETVTVTLRQPARLGIDMRR